MRQGPDHAELPGLIRRLCHQGPPTGNGLHHLRDLALDAFTTRAEVAHIETSLIFECTRTKVMPNYRTVTR